MLIRVVVLLLFLLPLRLWAQPGQAQRLPAGLSHPDSLRAWVLRPEKPGATPIRKLFDASLSIISTDIDSSRALARAAVALAWRQGQGKGLVASLGLLADGDYYAGDYLAAQQDLEMLLWAAQRAGLPERVGHAYMGMGLVASALDNWAGAEQYFVRAQKVYAAQKPPHVAGELRGLANRAYNFLGVDSLDRARPLVRQAIALLRKLPNARHPAKYQALLGVMQEKDQQPDSATATFELAARLAHATDDLNPEADATLHLSGLALRRRDYPQALRYAQKAERLFHELGDSQEADALREQAVALASLNRPEAAPVLRRYLALSDSNRRAQRLKDVATAQARFDLAGQQARIRGLEQQRRISQLRAEQQTARARQYGLAAGGLLLLLLGGGGLTLQLARSRRRVKASEAALQQAYSTQQQLMRIIGHDLRGPMATFQQMTPLLSEAIAENDLADAMEMVRELDAGAQHLGALVDNLLDWARLQGGLVSCAPVRLRAATAVHSVAQLYEPMARRKGIALDVVVDDDLPVWADVDLLSTVLRNLVGNALKFTPRGGTVRLMAEAEGAGTVFSVQDSGRGMSATALAAALRDEHTASQRGTAQEAGTGLGLPLCRKFVALLGGQLRGEVVATGGMRFWFVLPQNGGLVTGQQG